MPGTNFKKAKAAFTAPMLLLSVESLPAGPGWMYELKLDGYRAMAIKADSTVQLRSRNNNDFTLKYPDVAKALTHLPDDTMLDGELVALDASGKPSFSNLQNHGAGTAAIFYYVFDVLTLRGISLVNETLDRRRQLLQTKVLAKLREPHSACG